MANLAPNWGTPTGRAGSTRGKVYELTSTLEGQAYSYALSSIDPESDTVVYSLLTPATFPIPGLSISSAGLISGTVGSVVSDNTYTFVVRTTDGTNVNDRTFSIFVEALNTAPVWTTPEGDFGDIPLNRTYSFQFAATDADNDPLTYALDSGTLPEGLTLSSSGLLSGTTTSANDYTFTLSVTDGSASVNRTFSISVVSSSTTNIAPIWLTPEGSLGTYNERTSVYITLSAYDFEGDPLTFAVDLQSIDEHFPSGLYLNSSGTIYGALPSISIDTTYTFTIAVSDGENEVLRTFTLTSRNVSGNIKPYWNTTPGHLGDLYEFYASPFSVSATDPGSLTLTYSLVGGTLPDGLSLDSSTGYITGVPGVVDEDTTSTFTIRAANFSDYVDGVFSITVKDFVIEESMQVVSDKVGGINKEFMNSTLSGLFAGGNASYIFRPTDSCFGVFQDFAIYLVSGLPLFPEGVEEGDPANEFYKIIADDPSVTQSVKVVVSKQLSGFHYKSVVYMTDLQVASARDPITNEVIYDVLYTPIVDPQQGASYRPDLVNYDSNPASLTYGKVVGQSSDNEEDPAVAYPQKYATPYQDPNFSSPIETTNSPDSNPESIDFIAPNSLDNMRAHIIDCYGGIIESAVPVSTQIQRGYIDENEPAPLWMKSQQVAGDDTSKIGWTPAVLLAYLKPGTGTQFLSLLTTEQKNSFLGLPAVIDRHFVSTTPILDPTTRFGDYFPITFFGPQAPPGTGTDEDSYVEPVGETVDDVTKLDVYVWNEWGFAGGPADIPAVPTPPATYSEYWQNQEEPWNYDRVNLDTVPVFIRFIDEINNEEKETKFDGVANALYTRYILFPPGDKGFDPALDTVTDELLKPKPAIDIVE